MTECSAQILSAIDAHDGKTAIFGCRECGWEERTPIVWRDGGWHSTSTYWCRKNPPTIEVSVGPSSSDDPGVIHIDVTKT